MRTWRVPIVLFAVLLASKFVCLAAASPEVLDQRGSWADETVSVGIVQGHDAGGRPTAYWEFADLLVHDDGEVREVGSTYIALDSWEGVELAVRMWLALDDPQAAQSPAVLQAAKEACKKSVVEGCCGVPYAWPPCSDFCWFKFTVHGGGAVTSCSGACKSDHGGQCPPKEPNPDGPPQADD